MFLKNDHKYDDIINLERPKSKKHKPMSMYARSCQFAPYAALTGYDEMVKKTAIDMEEEFSKEGIDENEE
jgi:hypothetical protein